MLAPRQRQRVAHHLLAQGVHPADEALPRRLPLLHVRAPAETRGAGVHEHRGGARDRARRCRRRLPRGALHPRRQARAALPGRPRGVGGLRILDDARISRTRGTGGARGDRALAARQSRGDVRRRPLGAAVGERLSGDHAGDLLAAALGAGRAALRLTGQASGAATRDDPPCGRAARAVHDRDPDGHRRDPRGADRGAARDPGAGGEVRARAGGDRPELPRQARHADGGLSGAVARRAALDGRRGQGRPRPALEHPGAAEPEL